MIFRRTKKVEDELRGYKDLIINRMHFKIKRINPLIDFPSDKIPQIFTDFYSRRKPTETNISLDKIKKYQSDMYDIIYAGVVEPELVPVGKTGGITAEDLFREPSLGAKLYHEILYHSLNHFKGLNRLFFWIGTKFSLLMLYADGMDKLRPVSPSRKEMQA